MTEARPIRVGDTVTLREACQSPQASTLRLLWTGGKTPVHVRPVVGSTEPFFGVYLSGYKPGTRDTFDPDTAFEVVEIDE
jgi:hypothetical protein